jgi:hypothetical protein
MMLAAPELVVAERIELFNEIEVAAELQHRMLADRMMRPDDCLCSADVKLRAGKDRGKSKGTAQPISVRSTRNRTRFRPVRRL